MASGDLLNYGYFYVQSETSAVRRVGQALGQLGLDLQAPKGKVEENDPR